MKVKKARKRLQRVEGMLTAVLDGYTHADNGVHDLLDQAKSAVSDARTRLQKRATKKPPATASEPAAPQAVTVTTKRGSKAKRSLRKTA
jgi:hypothetical protein